MRSREETYREGGFTFIVPWKGVYGVEEGSCFNAFALQPRDYFVSGEGEALVEEDGVHPIDVLRPTRLWMPCDKVVPR